MSQRRSITLVLLLLCLGSAPASAQRILHRVRFGDSFTTLSKRFYGSRTHAAVLALANGTPVKTQPRAGSFLRVPTAYHLTVKRTTSVQGLAASKLGHRRWWPALVHFNGLRGGKRARVRAGSRVLIPFVLTIRTGPGERLVELTKRLYGNAALTRMIAACNQLKRTSPTSNTDLELPFGLQLDSTILETLVREKILGLSERSVKEHRQGLQEANALVRRGDYWEVPLRLLRLLAQETHSDQLIAETFKLLAVAYVAMDRHGLAVESFKEALLRDPKLDLDVVTTSPKVLRAFVDARMAREGK